MNPPSPNPVKVAKVVGSAEYWQLRTGKVPKCACCGETPHLTSEPSSIEDLLWSAGYSPEPHKCDPKYEPECPGQECHYNALCGGGCDTVLSPSVHIYCLERSGKELTACSSCYENLHDAMIEEGGWSVDGEPLTQVNTCHYCGSTEVVNQTEADKWWCAQHMARENPPGSGNWSHPR
jgi:hypothetical protein